MRGGAVEIEIRKKGCQRECQGVSTGIDPNGAAGGGKDQKGKSDGNERQEEEGEGKDGYQLGYTPTP